MTHTYEERARLENFYKKCFVESNLDIKANIKSLPPIIYYYPIVTGFSSNDSNCV